jgi:TonB family protein
LKRAFLFNLFSVLVIGRLLSQSLTVPSEYYQPLPRAISINRYTRIPDLVIEHGVIISTSGQRKEYFTSFYELKDDIYQLVKTVPIEVRPSLWAILSDAGLKPKDEEAKAGRSELLPTVISFNLTKDNRKESVEIIQSSGEKEIDEWGLLFFLATPITLNADHETIPCRFTYRFYNNMPSSTNPGKTAEQSAKIEPPKAPAFSIPAAPAPAAQQAVAAEPWVPSQREQDSRVSDTTSMLYVPGKGNVPWTGSTTNIHKAEKGSSSDTLLGGAQGTVGYNIYLPIFYSLPLPRQVPAAIYNAIPDLVQPPNTVIYSAQARKKAFAMYYEFDGAAYRLKADVPVDKREPLWEILEDAGYDFASADFRKGGGLSPVVIGFTVTRDKQVKGVEVLQSSGDPAIDQAVLYGFKHAAFWNKTGETVPGRFTYRF